MPQKYFINNIPLKEWCKNNNYPYSTARKHVTENKSITEEELKKILDTVKKKKYFYKGESLYDYCKKNNLNYNKFLRRVEELIRNENICIEEAVTKAIESYEDIRCNFKYNGMSLRKFCEINGYNYQRIYRRIKDDTNIEIINKKIEDFLNDNPKEVIENYKIEGLSLKAYCNKYNYVYPTMKTYIQNIIKDNPSISKNEAAKKAIEYYKTKHVSKEKWFYHGQRLVDYCNNNNYEYNYIISYLIKYVVDCSNITDEEIEIAKKKYNMWQRKKSFRMLKQTKSIEECIDIIKILNIDVESIFLVMKYNIDYKSAIYFIWYFGYDKNGKIMVDDNRIKEVFNNKDRLDKLELNELIGYYKSNICDTRAIIYKKTFLSIRKIVRDLAKYNNINKKEEIDELSSQADMLLLNYIEQTNSRYLGQIINHMNKSIKWFLYKYICNELRPNTISLSSPKFEKKELIDYVSDKSDIVDTEYISTEFKLIIRQLDFMEIKYIVLRYQKQLENYEISKILMIDESKLEELNNSILEKLRTNADVKKLIRK